MLNEVIRINPITGLAGDPLSTLISAVGANDFAGHLLSYINRVCGAEHCSVFEYRDAELSGRVAASLDRSHASERQSDLYIVGGYWRRDPGLLKSQQLLDDSKLGLLSQEVDDVVDDDLRDTIWRSHDVRHRLLLCSGTPENALFISLLRTGEKGGFSSEDVDNLVNTGATVLSLVRKHAAVSWSVPRLPAALTNLASIEACMANGSPRFPQREFQVAARLIYGMTTCGIALDLGIGEGSVMTYRKRIYERLHIASQRELLIWYLAVWEKTFGEALAGNA